MFEGVIYFSFVCAGSGAAPASLCWKLAPVALLFLSFRQALFLHKFNLNKFTERLSVGCQHLAFHYFPDKEPHLKLLLLTSFLSFCFIHPFFFCLSFCLPKCNLNRAL